MKVTAVADEDDGDKAGCSSTVSANLTLDRLGGWPSMLILLLSLLYTLYTLDQINLEPALL